MKFKNPFQKIKSNEKLLGIKNEYGYLGYAFLVPAVIMLAIYFSLGHKPLGDNSVLTLDLNAQYVYFYEALRDFVWGDSSLLYSFSRSLGGEFMGIYAYYVASPLSYIVAIFPKSMMLFALLTIIVIKVGLCGLTFGFYLHKQSPSINKNAVILFSTMYALSAYTITYQNNIMWLDGVFLLPILTYSIERLIKTGRYKLYVITLALMMMSHYYIGYMLCWYTAFCFFFSYFKDENRAIVNPTGRKLNFVKTVAKMAGSTLLGIGMSAFMIGAAYYSLQFGKSDFSEPSWDIVARFELFDLFPKLLPGSYDTVMHEGLPLLYCGILTLLMLPIFVMAKRVPSREKIFYVGFTLLYVLIMVINPLDLIMHGFQEPNCLNYRYSFIVIFLMVTMAYKGFAELEEHSPKKVFAAGSVILALLLVAQKMEFPNFVNADTEDRKYGFVLNKLPFFWVVVFTIIAVFAVGAAVCHFMKTKNKEKAAQILLAVVCIELFANGLVLILSMAFNIGWSSYSSYADYFETLRPIVDTVQDSDKTFYRSEKTTHRCTNDNMALGIRGLSNSTSTLNQKAIDLIEYLGYYADCHWTQNIGSTLVTDSLFGVKYVYSNVSNDYNKESLAQNALMDLYYELYTQDEYYYAYKNPYALGLAFGVSDLIHDLETTLKYDLSAEDGLKNPFEAQNQLLNALLGNTEDEYIDFYTSIPLKRNVNITGVSTMGSEYVSSSSSSDSEVKFKFTVEENGPLYLCLPTEYQKSFTVKVNGEHYVSNSIYTRIYTLGYREAGEELEVSLTPDDGKIYFNKNTDYFYTLDMEAFEEAFAELSKTSLVTDERSSDDHIYGSLTTLENNKTIMTTIPYDAGWKVYVDGKRVEAYSVYGDSLMAFDIETAGEHQIEFKYMPDIYVITGIISAFSTAIFVALIILDTRKKNKTAVAVADVEPTTEETEKTEGEN